MNVFKDALARLAAHGEVLRKQGAPHQQGLADDIATVTEGAAPITVENSPEFAQSQANVDSLKDQLDAKQRELDTANDKLKNFTDNTDNLMRERDAARAQVKDLQAENDRLREAASGQTGLGIASTSGQSMADIKRDGLQGATTEQGTKFGDDPNPDADQSAGPGSKGASSDNG